MSFVFQILLNVAVFILIPRKIYLTFFASKRYRLRKELKHLIHLIKHQIKVNRDLYGEERLQKLLKIKERCEKFLDSSAEEIERVLSDFESEYLAVALRQKNRGMHELTDTLVIAFAVAFGVRALYMQPFKIPTGSMQPTLYGIHLTEGGNEVIPNHLVRLFNYINYSWRYPEARALNMSQVAYRGVAEIGSEKLNYPMMENQKVGGVTPYQNSEIVIGMVNSSNTLFPQPAAIPEVYRSNKELSAFYLRYMSGLKGKTFQQGENILNVRHTTGDHIFVDRVSYYFSEPARGDVAVFITDGFPAEPSGKPSMAGRYYIKRLVGMPGDTLKVVDGKLYVKEKDANDFRVVDENDHEGFGKMYSGKGGYRGYANEGCFSEYEDDYEFLDKDDETGELYVSTYKQQPFTAKEGMFTVPENYYFMMGDNSYNSRDSRYFGPIPRENIMGKALFCWWPISRRWGVVDTVEPEEYDSASKLQSYDFDKQ